MRGRRGERRRCKEKMMQGEGEEGRERERENEGGERKGRGKGRDFSLVTHLATSGATSWRHVQQSPINFHKQVNRRLKRAALWWSEVEPCHMRIT